ncbi:DUF3164 family protein [Aquimarina algiphila]|uniref:DUF3164 family protein n=1 Tax=Aquimarina algiphila TaxID=2047982 RepID=A0A554VA78_9FLAO|nr:DUF3164 family protein [Aquimarina algiphila]TSE02804.1 DUF3164 family protein [Aquimarina algiphila]
MTIKQTSKDKFWYDESGQAIPYNRTTKTERLMERRSSQLLKDAEGIHHKLSDFKANINLICREVYETFMKDKGLIQENRKGNFTWFNFNRTIKIEVSVTDRIEFDDLTIQAAKEKFHQFLDTNISSNDEFIKQMVLDAFETSKGKLDTRKVFDLIRYKTKIKKPLFQQAVQLLQESIRRPESRTYFRVWLKDENGKYNNVDLNFSSI